jgi:hypothetical protein
MKVKSRYQVISVETRENEVDPSHIRRVKVGKVRKNADPYRYPKCDWCFGRIMKEGETAVHVFGEDATDLVRVYHEACFDKATADQTPPYFVPPCTCRPIPIEGTDRVMIGGMDDCIIHGVYPDSEDIQDDDDAVK